MFNKIWQKEVNSKDLFTQEQVNEVKEELMIINRKIRSKEEVIEAYLTNGHTNQKRILANQKAIEELELKKTELSQKLQTMEEKNVNRKET
jgi:chromosome segregation ATPase